MKPIRTLIGFTPQILVTLLFQSLKMNFEMTNEEFSILPGPTLSPKAHHRIRPPKSKHIVVVMIGNYNLIAIPLKKKRRGVKKSIHMRAKTLLIFNSLCYTIYIQRYQRGTYSQNMKVKLSKQKVKLLFYPFVITNQFLFTSFQLERILVRFDVISRLKNFKEVS